MSRRQVLARELRYCCRLYLQQQNSLRQQHPIRLQNRPPDGSRAAAEGQHNYFKLRERFYITQAISIKQFETIWNGNCVKINELMTRFPTSQSKNLSIVSDFEENPLKPSAELILMRVHLINSWRKRMQSLCWCFCFSWANSQSEAAGHLSFIETLGERHRCITLQRHTHQQSWHHCTHISAATHPTWHTHTVIMTQASYQRAHTHTVANTVV